MSTTVLLYYCTVQRSGSRDILWWHIRRFRRHSLCSFRGEACSARRVFKRATIFCIELVLKFPKHALATVLSSRQRQPEIGQPFSPLCHTPNKADGVPGEIGRAEAAHVLEYAGIPQVNGYSVTVGRQRSKARWFWWIGLGMGMAIHITC